MLILIYALAHTRSVPYTGENNPDLNPEVFLASLDTLQHRLNDTLHCHLLTCQQTGEGVRY